MGTSGEVDPMELLEHLQQKVSIDAEKLLSLLVQNRPYGLCQFLPDHLLVPREIQFLTLCLFYF